MSQPGGPSYLFLDLPLEMPFLGGKPYNHLKKPTQPLLPAFTCRILSLIINLMEGRLPREIVIRTSSRENGEAQYHQQNEHFNS